MNILRAHPMQPGLIFWCLDNAIDPDTHAIITQSRRYQQFHQSQYNVTNLSTNIDMSRQIMSAKYNPAHTQDDITSSTKFRTNIYYFIEMSTCAQEEKYNNNFQTKNVSRHGPRGDGGVENYFQSFRCRWRRVDHLWGEPDSNGTSLLNLAIVSYKSWSHWQYIDWLSQ